MPLLNSGPVTTTLTTAASGTHLYGLLPAYFTPANPGGQKGVSAADINTGINSNGVTNLINSQTAGSGTNPKAGLCWILFDEQLNYANAGFIRNNNGSGDILTLYNTTVPVTKNAYPTAQAGLFICILELKTQSAASGQRKFFEC